MEGNDELRKLSILLRLGANTARQIASIRLTDKNEIEHLADQAERIADELQGLTSVAAADLLRVH